MKPSLRWMLETPESKICTHCLSVKPVAEMRRPGMCGVCANTKEREYSHKKYGPPRVKLTDEEKTERSRKKSCARNKRMSKSGWPNVELRAYQKATTALVKLAKKHFFQRPSKKFYTGNGKVFDTEFERDEYVRGWREYREWCAENHEAIKRAAYDRANERKRERNRERGVPPIEERRARAIQTKRERQRWKDYKKRKSGIGGRRLPWDFEERRLREQDGKCGYCKCDIRDDFHMDHIVPVSKGGCHEEWNLWLLCPACNMTKSDKDHSEVVERLAA